MFASMGSALPAPTQFVVDASEFAQSNLFYLIAAAFLQVLSLKKSMLQKKANSK
ncbi:type IV pilus assembly protein PilC [Candidatus Electrothrix communis]|uniref:Type IV pilus assembly protein PilC n=1 Tax=Candidatus Electrothrix communis TaxID=1859133 RepID=A0A3S3R5H7_9BACT|nr:type IV pilus assembly protein PilC [Candidatus Electrothrix communis]